MAVSLSLAAGACGGGEGGPTEPEPEPDPSPGPATGTLEVSTATAGAEPDPDGYTVRVDGEGGSEAIGATDTLLFTDLAEGDHTVELTNVQANCSLLEEGNPRTITVPASDTVSTHFAFSCPGRAALEVTTSTVAGGLDPDGFRVAVDGEGERTIGTDDVDLFTGLASGEHTVELSGLESGCSVDGQNPRSVTAPVDDTAGVAFRITCGLRGRIVFASNRGEIFEGPDDIYVVDEDGSNLDPLTSRSDHNGHPAVSPDGSLVAFESNRSGNMDIWVIEADGTDPRPVTTHLASDREPVWSPDGTRIAFTSDRGGGDAREIWTVAVDGTLPEAVTDDGGSDWAPAWSPDGSRIAFESDRDGTDDIWLIAPDGTGLTNLTQSAADDRSPAWSPDGYKIAFDRRSTDIPGVIHTVCANGANQPEPVPDGPDDSFDPDWSPDGERIAFSNGSFEASVYIMDSDGSTPDRLTEEGRGNNVYPTWTPGGASGPGGIPTLPPECQQAAPSSPPDS